MALLKLEALCPGWVSGWRLLQDTPQIEAAVIALASATNTSMTDIERYPIPKLIRQLKKVAELRNP